MLVRIAVYQTESATQPTNTNINHADALFRWGMYQW
jgi:hypothetical protein